MRRRHWSRSWPCTRGGGGEGRGRGGSDSWRGEGRSTAEGQCVVRCLEVGDAEFLCEFGGDLLGDLFLVHQIGLVSDLIAAIRKGRSTRCTQRGRGSARLRVVVRLRGVWRCFR